MTSRVSTLASSLSALDAMRVSVAVWLPLAAVTVAGRAFGGDIAGVGELVEVILITLMAILLSQVFRLLIVNASGWSHWKVWVVIGAITAGLSVAHAPAANLLVTQPLQFLFEDVRTPQLGWAAIGALTVTHMLVYGLNAGLIWAVAVGNQARSEAANAARAEAAAAQAELRALRLQLNPHFLFNSLNGLLSLVRTQRQNEAERTILKLSDFLRSALEFDPSGKVALHEELESAEAYLEIELVRYQHRLQIEFDCPDHLRLVPVPDLLLQPLVENVVKYAVAPSQAPVTLSVQAVDRGDMVGIIIQNEPGGEAIEAAGGLGIGLANCRKRLESLYGDRWRLEIIRLPNRFRVEIDLPRA